MADSPTDAEDDDLTSLQRSLVEHAEDAQQYASVHLSGYSVGAVVRLESGVIGKGANFENDNYSSTLHAEETAYGNALMNRANTDTIPGVTHVAVVTSGNDLPEPCGECKQVLTQHAIEDMKMILSNGDTHTVRDFPHQFRLPDN